MYTEKMLKQILRMYDVFSVLVIALLALTIFVGSLMAPFHKAQIIDAWDDRGDKTHSQY